MKKTLLSIISVAVLANTLSSSLVNISTQAAFAPVDVIKLTNFRNYVQMDGTGYNFGNGVAADIPTNDGTGVLFTGTNTDIVPAGSDKLVPAPNKDTFIDLNGNRPGFLTTNELKYEVGDQLQLTFSYISNINANADLNQNPKTKKAIVSVGGESFDIDGVSTITDFTSPVIIATELKPLLFKAINIGSYGIMVSNIKLVNLGKTLGTATPVKGQVGTAFPSIVLTRNTAPDNTPATFTPKGSTPVKGIILNNKFKANDGQLIPLTATVGPSIGTLDTDKAPSITVDTNFTLAPVDTACKTLIPLTKFSQYDNAGTSKYGFNGAVDANFTGTNIDIVPANNGSGIYSNQSSTLIDLNAESEGSLVSKELTYNNGDLITLSFDYGSNTPTGVAETTNAIVKLDSFTKTIDDRRPGGELTKFTTSFTATDSPNILSFQSNNPGAGGIVVTNIEVLANCQKPVVNSGGGSTITLTNTTQTQSSSSVNTSSVITNITNSVAKTAAVLGFEVGKPKASTNNSNSGTLDSSKTKILVTTDTKKVIDSAKGGTFRTGGF